MSVRSRMKILASAGAVLAAVAGLNVLGAAGASAKTPPATSPAGSYAATLTIPKQKPLKTTLTLTANKHFSFGAGGPSGKWTETGTALTMTGTIKKVKITFVFTITQRGADLGSRAHPGALTANGQPDSTWWAVPA
jgi:hypothetical protein